MKAYRVLENDDIELDVERDTHFVPVDDERAACISVNLEGVLEVAVHLSAKDLLEMLEDLLCR